MQLGIAGGLTKSHMVRNDATPKIEIDPETYQVTVDGKIATCEPAKELPLTQLFHGVEETAFMIVRHVVEASNVDNEGYVIDASKIKHGVVRAGKIWDLAGLSIAEHILTSILRIIG